MTSDSAYRTAFGGLDERAGVNAVLRSDARRNGSNRAHNHCNLSAVFTIALQSERCPHHGGCTACALGDPLEGSSEWPRGPC